MRSKEFFKKIDRKKYIIWCDTGSHFRCSEVVCFFLNELKKEKIDVTLNFFGDKHGKNLRDQHFSTISNFIKRESFVRQLTSTADIINAINKRQEISNLNRSLKGKKNMTRKLKPIKTIADEFIAAESETNTFKKIPNIRCFYQFSAKAPDFLPMSTVFSDRDKSIEVKFIGGFINSKTSIIEDEETISVEQVSLKSIIEKKKHIEAIFKSDLPKYCYNSKSEALVNKKKLIFFVKANKKRCAECKAKCAFKIEDLKIGRKINTKNIIQELRNHNHPSSQKLNGKQRNVLQAKDQLIEHYLFSHYI